MNYDYQNPYRKKPARLGCLGKILVFTIVGSIVSFWMLFRPFQEFEKTVVIFKYEHFIDDYLCKPVWNIEVTPEKVESMEATLSDLKKSWRQYGLPMLARSAEIIEQNFFENEKTIRLHICPLVPSIPFLPLVSVNGFLPTDTTNLIGSNFLQNQSTDPMEFVDTVLHKILQIFTVRVLVKNLSYQWTNDYTSESLATRLSLHAYALQKEVYLQMGYETVWNQLVQRSSSLPGFEARAIEIVEVEGTEIFLQDLYSH